MPDFIRTLSSFENSASRNRASCIYHRRHFARAARSASQRYHRSAFLPRHPAGADCQTADQDGSDADNSHPPTRSNPFASTYPKPKCGRAANRRGGIHRRTDIMKKRLILILNGKGGVGKVSLPSTLFCISKTTRSLTRRSTATTKTPL